MAKRRLQITDILIHKIVLFCSVTVTDSKSLWQFLDKFTNVYLMVFSTDLNYKHQLRCSEDQNNLRYALITIVLRYIPHSPNLVLRKPTRVFLLLSSVPLRPQCYYSSCYVRGDCAFPFCPQGI